MEWRWNNMTYYSYWKQFLDCPAPELLLCEKSRMNSLQEWVRPLADV